MIVKKLKSIFGMRCPHCLQDSFFEGLFVKGNVKSKCEKCQRSFTKETGFYQGSYYVSYGLGVASFVAMWIATEILMSDGNVLKQLLIILGGMIVLMPFLYPLSKIIWANIFFKYKGLPKEI